MTIYLSRMAYWEKRLFRKPVQLCLLLLLPSFLFAQEKTTVKIPWGSRSYILAEVLATPQTGCVGKASAMIDPKINDYAWSWGRDPGYLLHGRLILINSFSDTQRTGQYVYGRETGRFIEKDPYNKRIASIIDYDTLGMRKRKDYHFDDNRRILLSVTADSFLIPSRNDQFWDRLWRKIYDTTETFLLREEISLNGAIKKVITYYRNGKINQVYRVGNGESFEFRRKRGEYEEFYENGKRKAVGSYYDDEPVGVWLYFDSKGKKTAKNHTKFPAQ